MTAEKEKWLDENIKPFCIYLVVPPGFEPEFPA